MKYCIHIYGCQMNRSDAERVSALLENLGYEKTSDEQEADLAVFVACAVRESAVARLYGNGKKFKRYRKKNPRFKAVLTGCVVKEDHAKLEKIFDIIMDIKNLSSLPEKLGFPDALDNKDADYFQIMPEHSSPYTAYVPIMTGCNNFCSYCIVPYTRGREYSRPTGDIIKEVRNLVDKGCKEIILLGQNVNSYRPDKDTDFPALLREVDRIEGRFWVRFLTSHPKDMTEKLIETVRDSRHCTNYIHLALQSGDDEILSKMNRRYTKEHFLGLVKMIRDNIPDVMLTTDIIVGFPTETEEQFEKTADVMEAAKFDIAYINKYSPRAGTVSAKMKDDISWQEKKEREKRLNVILKKTALENNQEYEGKTIEVLIEKEDERAYYGKTRSFKDIRMEKSVPSLTGEFVQVKVISCTPWALEGEIIQQ